MTHCVSTDTTSPPSCLMQTKYDLQTQLLRAGSVAAAAGFCNSNSTSGQLHHSSSRSSWDENILALSRDLQVICGSPTKTPLPELPQQLHQPQLQQPQLLGQQQQQLQQPQSSTSMSTALQHSPVMWTRPIFQRNMSLSCLSFRSSSAALVTGAGSHAALVTGTGSHAALVTGTGSHLHSPSGALGSICAPIPGRMRLLRRTDSQDQSFHLHQHQHQQQLRHTWRRILVRHEETKSLLDQQLARLLKSDDGEPKHVLQKPYKFHRRSDSQVPAAAAAAAMYYEGAGKQTSTKTGFLFKVELEEQIEAEDLFLSFIDDRFVRICWTGGGGGTPTSVPPTEPTVLGEVLLPTEVPLNSLVYTLSDDHRWVYVQERQQTTAIDFSPTCSAKYLPLLHENDMTSQLDIVLKIPSEFDQDDVMVKTIDDTVVITGAKRAFAIMLGSGNEGGGSGGRSSPAFGFSNNIWPPVSASHYFQIIMPLPHGAQRRTISAYLTGHKHLVVTGKLRPATRRYTF